MEHVHVSVSSIKFCELQSNENGPHTEGMLNALLILALVGDELQLLAAVAVNERNKSKERHQEHEHHQDCNQHRKPFLSPNLGISIPRFRRGAVGSIMLP